MQYESMIRGKSSLPVQQKVSWIQKKGQVTIRGEIVCGKLGHYPTCPTHGWQ